MVRPMPTVSRAGEAWVDLGAKDGRKGLGKIKDTRRKENGFT